MVPLHASTDHRPMEELAVLLGVTVAFTGALGGVLWAIAAMTGGSGEEPRSR